MKRQTEFKIYRLCRDEKTITRFKEEGRKYQLPEQVLITGPDYFTFIEGIIRDCKDDFALLCHDDVVVPLNIAERVAECIEKANQYCGSEKWGMVGNAGVEAISLRTVRFLKDPHTAVVPYRSTPIPVVSVDGNVTLLNIKNLRKNKFELPATVRGFHMYDFISLVECYRKKLLVLADSSLYVYHRSGGVQKGFDEFSSGSNFQEYWTKNFVNHTVHTINGPVKILNPDYGYLKEDSKDHRMDFYSLVKKQILSIEDAKIRPVVNIVTKTNLRNLNMLKRMLQSVKISRKVVESYIDLKVIISINNAGSVDVKKAISEIENAAGSLEIKFIECDNKTPMAPRLYAVKCAVESVKSADNQFIWIIDDDDFVFPKELKTVSKYLDSNTIFIGQSESFDETWSADNTFPDISVGKPGFYNEISYARNYLGDNHVPVCSVIFPAKALEEVFSEHQLLGDYYEDYAMLFLAQIKYNVQYLPILIAGVSHHDKNTVFENDRTHWDYSYTTFLSEITNAGVVNNSSFELNSTLDNYSRNYKSGKFLLGLAFGKTKTLLGLLVRLKIRTLYNTLRSYR